MKRKKGFTLIELITVLVILAILSLIVTPLVMNVISKARTSANKRSIDAYGKAIELAISSYLLDNGTFPTNVEQLTIEYSGDKVECETTNINSDSTVYLSNCKVNNKIVEGYTYGTKEEQKSYKIGDEVTYKGINFYVIADSDENSNTVTLLKAESLTTEEVNKYGSDHINKYTSSSVGTAPDNEGYGYMAYYTSAECGYTIPDDYNSMVTTACETSYDKSDVKYVVDGWAQDKLLSSDLVEDSTGYSARLITYNELINQLDYENDTYKSWINANRHGYWTMTPNSTENNLEIWSIVYTGAYNPGYGTYFYYYLGKSKIVNFAAVRPVITINKSALN